LVHFSYHVQNLVIFCFYLTTCLLSCSKNGVEAQNSVVFLILYFAMQIDYFKNALHRVIKTKFQDILVIISDGQLIATLFLAKLPFAFF
jgi:hypothetical protein